MRYNFKKIESKWQNVWERERVYIAKDKTTKRKEYVLIEFPYPSGEGLHMGHLRPYVAGDVYSRFWRMRGREVMYPMGWDAFGLPAENYAIKKGIHPSITTARNIKNAKAQVKSWGISFDWSREVNTTDPHYYKWTQWIFLQFYKAGLAYEAEGLINWCPKDKTGLANEEVVGGRCERCGTLVEQKVVRQWYLRITAYAEKLLDGLKKLDWPNEIKLQQENWIGKSEGAEIEFTLSSPITSREIVFASNNRGKLKRMQHLLKVAGLPFTLKTPADIGIPDFSVEETGKTLRENAEMKARALQGKTHLPILADDSGFFIKGEVIDPVKVKRNALKGLDEKKLSIAQIGKKMLDYYRSIADSYGGSVDAEWRNLLCLITPEGEALMSEAVRPVILTNTPRGTMDPYLPLRPLYVSKATGKHVLEQSAKEELKELQPITESIAQLLTPSLKVFTTRPDTLFGATYLVVSPEHPLLRSGTLRITNRKEVESYRRKAEDKTEEERTGGGKEKTGVKLEGVTATNPATGKKIPVWVADYVLGNYGTGAIMAVPAHDERDHEFAQKYHLPIQEVVEPMVTKESGEDAFRRDMPVSERRAVVAVIKHWSEEKYLGAEWLKTGWKGFVIGGIEPGEKAATAGLREIVEETGFEHPEFVRNLGGPIHARFFQMVKKENRLAHFEPVVFRLKDGARKEISEEEKSLHNFRWIPAAEFGAFITHPDMRIVWNRFEGKALYSGEGILVNSGKFTGMSTAEAKKLMAQEFGAPKVQYHLRDWVFSRQRYWGEPIPLIHCSGCGIVPVPEKDLPVKLPSVKKYEPTGTGESPLAAVTKWVNTKCPTCKGPAKRETNTMPQWAGSSWYYLRYTDPKNRTRFASPNLLERWLPIDVYFGGAEHTTLHLLYSRFWHRFLYDQKLVPTAEPYKLRIQHGIILASDGEKMSKSRGNVVNPDEIVKRFGADTLRMYELFLGPHGATVGWTDGGILGIARFLERTWRLYQKPPAKKTSDKALRALNRAIQKVEVDIAGFRFNTAISALMILLNEVEGEELDRRARESFAKILAPFAPHIAEELWRETLGNKGSIHLAPWSKCDRKFLKSETFSLVIQINGKVRGSVTAESDLSEARARELALEDPRIQEILGDREPKRVIYVPGRLVNIVI